MNRLIVIVAIAATGLAACAEKPKVVSVTHTAKKPAPKAITKSRSEPIFYNGKTYNLAYDYAASANAFDMRVSGMAASQQKDAVAVATSSLGYFACPEGQRGQLTGAPRYEAAQWKMQARCG